MTSSTPQKPLPKNKRRGGKTVFSIYSQAAFEHPWLFSGVIFGTLLTQIADLVSPLYMKQFFNILVLNHASATIVHGLIITLAIIAGLSLMDWLFTRLQVFSVIYLEARVMSNLYSSAFDYLIAHSYQFFTNQFTGTLTRRISKFSVAFESLIESVLLQFAPTAIFVTGAVIILFVNNHTLGLLLGAWAIAFVLFQVWVARIRQPLRVASSVEDSRMTGALADALSNQTTIALFAGNSFEHIRFVEALTRWKVASLRSWNADEIIWAGMGLFIVFINIAMLYGAIIFWERGLLTIGDFVLIQAYLITTFQQLVGINRNLRRFYDSYADATEMVEILNTPHEIKDAAGAKDLAVADGVIDLKDVQFYFHENHPILEDFNLKIAGNEKVALVGPSGAGKSTITKLLLRFYDVKGGAVLIDGQNISEVTQDTLRNAIAFVPQEPVLFHRTLMENIRYGRRDATDEEVLEAARKAHCHEFIQGFPDKYETYVGERGVRLSGGERQRVAIARALLKNAPILVLDEATSSLDSESESLIQSALDVLMEGKTVITIAHRLSTIMKMDRIVVIDGGEVVAQGTHDQLLEDENGLYHKLWSIQAGGFLTEESEDEPESDIVL